MEELNYKICLFSKKSYRNVISFNTIVDYVFKISCWKTHINHELILSGSSRGPLLARVLGNSLQFTQSKRKIKVLNIGFVRKAAYNFFLTSWLEIVKFKIPCWKTYVGRNRNTWENSQEHTLEIVLDTLSNVSTNRKWTQDKGWILTNLCC